MHLVATHTKIRKKNTERILLYVIQTIMPLVLQSVYVSG